MNFLCHQYVKNMSLDSHGDFVINIFRVTESKSENRISKFNIADLKLLNRSIFI